MCGEPLNGSFEASQPVTCESCTLISVVMSANIPKWCFSSAPFARDGYATIAALFFTHSVLGTSPRRFFDDITKPRAQASIWTSWCEAGTFEYLRHGISVGWIPACCRSCGTEPLGTDRWQRECRVCGFDAVAGHATRGETEWDCE